MEPINHDANNVDVDINELTKTAEGPSSDAPVTKEEEARRPLRIVFCVPGRSFSKRFFECWNNLVIACVRMGVEMVLSTAYSSNVYYVRNMALGADVLRGKNQKPFDGKIDYDFIMWIDSDIVFNPDQFVRLLSHNKDVVAGLYKMEGGKQFAVVENWDTDEFKKNGTFKFMDDDRRQELAEKELVPVDYTGFGWVLIKRGVFERLEYPWFHPEYTEFEGDVRDFCSEDVGFCRAAKRAGIELLIDPKVVVGHEKMTVLA
jgi:hypothetical protein